MNLLEQALNDWQHHITASSPQFQLLDIVRCNYQTDDGTLYTDDVGIVTGLLFSDGQSDYAPGWWCCVTWYSLPSSPHLPIPFVDQVCEADLMPHNSKADRTCLSERSAN